MTKPTQNFLFGKKPALPKKQELKKEEEFHDDWIGDWL